jgi:hypothetical protein
MQKTIILGVLSFFIAAALAACGTPDQTSSMAAPQLPTPLAARQPAPTPAPTITLDTATQTRPAVVPYESVFTVNADGSISPKVPVNAFGVRMGPGVTFGAGTSFGGVDIAALEGHDLQAYRNGSIVVIVGIHR